jgi:predicted component of type VI protein secretion system
LEGDLEISRQHATLEQQGGTFLVTCEGRNSIFVDSTEVLTGETAAVRPGQRISICSYVLTPQAVLAETVIYDNAQ